MSFNIFNSIKLPRVRRSTFDLSHEYKGSGNMADLIPILCQPVLPGDSWKVNSEVFMRFAPMYAPIMHRVNVYVHYFFVPNRLIWADFETFMTGGKDGTATVTFPYLAMNKTTADSYPLLDYLGYNNVSSDAPSTTQNISSLRMRGYQLIYNEYYRDENLESDLNVPTGNGSDASNLAMLCTLRQRAWEKDYFTASLPFAQRGNAVEIPNSADSLSIVLDPDSTDSGMIKNMTNPHTSGPFGTLQVTNNGELINSQASGVKQAYDPAGTLKVSGSINNSTIEELRNAYRLQEWLERNALGGARYNEMVYAHFGVKGSDARFQRPEYLGGFQAPVVVSEVLQQSATTEDSAQGAMAGHAVSGTSGRGMRKFFAEEHGYIYAIMSVIPRTTYQQGLDKDWTKFDRTDFGWPEFAHLGEQAVLKQEIYNDVYDNKNSETWGYVPRYAEYKHINSSVHGVFKTSLNDWHLGRIFSSRPVLNGSFVHAQVADTTRIFNVTDETTEHIYFEILHNIRAKRSLPKYGTPMM